MVKVAYQFSSSISITKDGVTQVINVGGSGILDRYGNLYTSPGVGGGKSKGKYSVSVAFNYLENFKGSKEVAMKDFLSGWGYSYSAGWGIGLVHSWSPTSTATSSGFGAFTPQIGIGVSFTPASIIRQTNIKW